MGDHFDEGYPADGELPLHEVRLSPFRMDESAVTNAQFATFCKATGYVTDAEQLGVSPVFHLAVEASRSDVLHALDAAPWWLSVRGADWRHPAGPLGLFRPGKGAGGLLQVGRRGGERLYPLPDKHLPQGKHRIGPGGQVQC